MTPRQIANTPTGQKVCGHCQKELPRNTDFFDRDSAKQDGFKNWCKTCRKEARELTQLKEVASVMKTMDMAIVSNMANYTAGGSNVPHAAEVCEAIFEILGGVRGFALHYAANLVAAKPGSQTRERMLGNLMRLNVALSDTNKVSMPAELMSDEDIESEWSKREAKMKKVQADIGDATEPE